MTPVFRYLIVLHIMVGVGFASVGAKLRPEHPAALVWATRIVMWPVNLGGTMAKAWWTP